MFRPLVSVTGTGDHVDLSTSCVWSNTGPGTLPGLFRDSSGTLIDHTGITSEENMLFLVVSKPAPTRPSDARSNRQRIWEWARPLMDRGVIKDRAMYAKVGRGAMAIFDVESNEELHRLLSQWLDLVPGEVEVSPLMDHDATAAFLSEDPTG